MTDDTYMARPRLLACDLDGTILPPGGAVSEADLLALEAFRKMGIATALVTGRSRFSFRRSIPQGLPFDHLVFSTGAGIWDNRRDAWEHIINLHPEQTSRLADALLRLGLDFMVQHAFPDNHHFSYHTQGSPVADFLRRLAIYDGYHDELDESGIRGGFEASQAIVIVERYDEGLIRELEAVLEGFKIVRTTSPIDRSSTWVEIFPAGVSKGSGLLRLCELMGIDPSETIAVGNDFNDIDMLEQAGRAFVVDTAPAELLTDYPSIPSDSPLEHIRSILSGD